MNPDIGLSVSFYVANLMVTVRCEVDFSSGIQFRWGATDALAGQDHRFVRGRREEQPPASILNLDDRYRRAEGAA